MEIPLRKRGQCFRKWRRRESFAVEIDERFFIFFLLREIEFIDLYKSVELWAAISLRQLLRRAFFIDSQRETS